MLKKLLCIRTDSYKNYECAASIESCNVLLKLKYAKEKIKNELVEI